jgi:hypothetical protein
MALPRGHSRAYHAEESGLSPRRQPAEEVAGRGGWNIQRALRPPRLPYGARAPASPRRPPASHTKPNRHPAKGKALRRTVLPGGEREK